MDDHDLVLTASAPGEAPVGLEATGNPVCNLLWTALHARYPAGVVAPFSLLVPVVGVAAAWLALDEVPSALSVVGGVVVISGVLLGLPPGRLPADSHHRSRPGTPATTR